MKPRNLFLLELLLAVAGALLLASMALYNADVLSAFLDTNPWMP